MSQFTSPDVGHYDSSPPQHAGISPHTPATAFYSPELLRPAKTPAVAEVAPVANAVVHDAPRRSDSGTVKPASGSEPAGEASFAGSASASTSESASQISSPPEFIDQYDVDSDDFKSRYIEIVDAHEKAEVPLQAVAVYTKQYKDFETSVLLEKGGRVFMRFDDFSRVTNAVLLFHQLNFHVEYITQQAYAQAKYQDPSSLNPYEGQIEIVFETRFADLVHTHSVESLEAIVFKGCALYGAVRHSALASLKTDNAPYRVAFRVEFQSIDAATRATALLTVCPLIYVDCQGNTVWTMFSVDAWTGPRTVNMNQTIPRDEHGRLIGFQHTSTMIAGVRRLFDHHNRVEVDRILKGQDVRSTIMLRNIPNKLDWLGLKQLLDKYCFGTYDFIYLRIDFQTQANVGYAFINFADIHGLVAMVRNVNGRPWAGFNSSKAAEISYATIQGKEALVTKFRNSSVMSETHNCRPRLFFTYADAMALDNLYITGSEQAFPEPDNRAKLERSKASIHQVGLFPPRNARMTVYADRRSRFGVHDNGNPREMATQHQHVQSGYPSRHNLPDNIKKSCELIFAMPFNHISDEDIAQFVAANQKFGAVRAQQVGPIRRPY